MLLVTGVFVGRFHGVVHKRALMVVDDHLHDPLVLEYLQHLAFVLPVIRILLVVSDHLIDLSLHLPLYLVDRHHDPVLFLVVPRVLKHHVFLTVRTEHLTHVREPVLLQHLLNCRYADQSLSADVSLDELEHELSGLVP